MVTVNEVIRDLEVRHQVGIQRLSSGILKTLIRLLDTADAEIVEKLRLRGPDLDGTFTSARFRVLLDTFREINRDAHVSLERDLTSELASVATYEAGFQRDLVLEALPVRWDMVTPPAETLKAAVVARPFQGRLLSEWVSELSEGKSRRLRDAIRLGVVQGETVDQIVKRVRGTKALSYRDGVMEIGRRGAEAMVRTAVAHTTTVAREALYEANRDVIAKEQWVSTLDTRTCTQCMSLDGKTFEIGKGIRTPAHIGCRCIRIPVTKSWKELGFDLEELSSSTRASMNGQVPDTETYGTWLAKQSAAVQDDALGATRGKLFRKGGLSVDRFTNRAGDEFTLDELRRYDSEAFRKAGLAA